MARKRKLADPRVIEPPPGSVDDLYADQIETQRDLKGIIAVIETNLRAYEALRDAATDPAEKARCADAAVHLREAITSLQGGLRAGERLLKYLRAKSH